MKRILPLILLVLFCSGCATIAKSQLPTILTSKEQQWTIPKGTPFKAIQKPTYPTLTEFIVTDDDLAVIYKGNLLELEQEANRRAIKAARDARTKGAVMGSIGSLLAIISSLIGKGIWNRVTKKKK